MKAKSGQGVKNAHQKGKYAVHFQKLEHKKKKREAKRAIDHTRWVADKKYQREQGERDIKLGRT